MASRKRWRSGLVGGLAAIFVALGLYGFWYEPASLHVVAHDIRLDAAARLSGTPLRIAVIADLHGGSPYIGEAKIEEVVALANGAKPDLILLTGDYVTKGIVGGSPLAIETIAGKLRGLSAPLGTYAVLGNHDRAEDAPRIAAALEEAGIHVLDDRAASLDHGGPVMLAGISDLRSGPHDIAAALVTVPAGQRALCFTHSPDIFPRLPATCALTIAGHTHGGQVRLPLLGSPIVPSSYGQRYAAGLIREGDKVLFVSTGIGTSIIPVRIGVPPEISILDIR